MKIRDYRKLFLNAPEPLMLVEVGSLTIRDANQRALSLVGYSEEELKELKLGAMLSPADCVRFLSATEPDADSAGIVDCTLSRKDGAPLPVDISTCMAGFDDLVLVALHDALEKSKMREQLRQAQKMEAVGMLA
jgi:nitrogen-specific signal transduction histidine kinase